MTDTTCGMNDETTKGDCGKPSTERWTMLINNKLVLYFCEDHDLKYHIAQDIKYHISSNYEATWKIINLYSSPKTELPCDACSRMNDIGVKICWCCGGKLC
jgi:hypothetical protein